MHIKFCEWSYTKGQRKMIMSLIIWEKQGQRVIWNSFGCPSFFCFVLVSRYIFFYFDIPNNIYVVTPNTNLLVQTNITKKKIVCWSLISPIVKPVIGYNNEIIKIIKELKHYNFKIWQRNSNIKLKKNWEYT